MKEVEQINKQFDKMLREPSVLRDLEDRFRGNGNAIALHYATDVALACLTQCLSEEDYIFYAWNEPYVRKCLTEEDLRRIWKKILEMEIL